MPSVCVGCLLLCDAMTALNVCFLLLLRLLLFESAAVKPSRAAALVVDDHAACVYMHVCTYAIVVQQATGQADLERL